MVITWNENFRKLTTSDQRRSQHHLSLLHEPWGVALDVSSNVMVASGQHERGQQYPGRSESLKLAGMASSSFGCSTEESGLRSV